MYLILKERTIHHEGDQRSRDYPGHGYPAHSETVVDVKEYVDVEKLEEAILALSSSFSKPKFRVFEATELKYATTVKVQRV